MRRTTLLLVVIGVLMVIGSAVAVAKNFTGTKQGETINGTSVADKISGGGGADTLKGKIGDDALFADFGNFDVLNGASGDDFLNAADGSPNDIVDAGDSAEVNGDTCVVDEDDQIVPVGGGTPLLPVPASAVSLGSCERVTVVGE